MYAIVDIAGQQFKVENEQRLFIHRLNEEPGKSIEFEKVLLVDDDGKISIGNPTVEGIKISAKVISHLRGDKVLVFKKKRRKGYQKLNGHRQMLTEIEIESIGGIKTTKPKKAKAVKAAKPNAEAETETKKEAEIEAKAATKTRAKTKSKKGEE
jgi:large subunit ribosomal protein L21